ncbi:hypothetical protein CHR28_09685 [Streptomyces sp. XY006]|nr:hypothetical protein CHR28_09685 [Streptomyces sp. XY006]
MNRAENRASAWIRPMGPRARGRGHLRLFCFPYAGSGARVFRGWAEALPDDVEVYGIQLPGRDDRLAERPRDDVPELVAELVAALEPCADAPFAFFGHSMGALLCWETARSLWRTHGLLPRHVFVSGCRPLPLVGDRTASGAVAPAPADDASGSRGIAPVPGDDELIEQLRTLGGTPEEILGDAGLMSVVLPAFRGDTTLLARYRHAPGEPLPCPATVFGGDRDPRVAPEELAGWTELFERTPDVCVLPGGHFFLHTQRERLLAEIEARLVRGRAPRHV